jgi:unsaturated rhamnogalacturonyl hydrolase
MSRWLRPLILLIVLAAFSQPTLSAGPAATVTVKNPIALSRLSETIVLGAAAIKQAMTVDDLRKVHVTDVATGKEILAQPVDVDDDGTFDEVIFQADLAPNATRTFALSVGERQTYTKDQFKAYGRFVRERRDDFAWENDRTAHRIYGKALETWAQEPLTSSSVDVWFKRTRRLVINDWYMVDNYHRDSGEGADMYSAGKSRGCGGNGIWADGRLYPSANFIDSRTLANGPIRVMFELTYPAWDAGGRSITEVKRITLDAGQNMNRFESRYTVKPAGPLVQAAGIKKHPEAAVNRDAARGLLRTWEPVKADGSHFGCGIIVSPATFVEFGEADSNLLVATKVDASGTAVYYAGAGWDKSGDFADVAAWDAYLAQAAERLRAPLVVTVAAR